MLIDLNLPGPETVKGELEKADPSANIQTALVKIDTSIETDVQRTIDEGVAAFNAIHCCTNNAGAAS